MQFISRPDSYDDDDDDDDDNDNNDNDIAKIITLTTLTNAVSILLHLSSLWCFLVQNMLSREERSIFF